MVQGIGYVLLTGGCILCFGCDESLPPRDDPQEFLDISFSSSGGRIELEKDLTPSTSSLFLGGWWVGVSNLYDEVLHAEEDINISIRYEVEGDTLEVQRTLTADWTSLVNKLMIDRYSSLTIRPGETARFYAGIEHDAERLWEVSGLTFHRAPGVQSDITWLQSKVLVLTGSGSARFFKSVAGHVLPEQSLVIYYHIHVDPPFIWVDSLRAMLDPGTGHTTVSWKVPFESDYIYGFMVEKANAGSAVFTLAADTLIRATGRGSYSWIDLSIPQGEVLKYRLQRWYNFGFAQVPIEPTDPAPTRTR